MGDHKVTLYKKAIYIIADLLGWAASFFVLEPYC